ncbi:MAG: amidohydrolase family protein, partial [Acidobacteria bacterium]|nr:amidohydrolase family protein [Acidobacteriota bacterium]
MRSAKIILCALGILCVCATAQRTSSQSTARAPAEGARVVPTRERIVPTRERIVIAASAVFDGRGRVVRDTRVVVEGSKIVAVDPKAAPVTYDLRGLTVLPGWIDAHVHITWSFGRDGKSAGAGETTQEAAYAAASNAWLTLTAGFTTVQSLGSPTDV